MQLTLSLADIGVILTIMGCLWILIRLGIREENRAAADRLIIIENKFDTLVTHDQWHTSESAMADRIVSVRNDVQLLNQRSERMDKDQTAMARDLERYRYEIVDAVHKQELAVMSMDKRLSLLEAKVGVTSPKTGALNAG